ncbi:acyl-CoA thioesterase [Flavobacteriaceae bacterium AU392]|nr:acyl-CoA thioesterase [Flavobacteriaceae bacterium]RKM86081.1 acyl-CoA thioesterase [Flavobacteriaceae bacterium AU392]
MKKVVNSKTKIRFQHCDPFNHLNNGNYIDYFMNHREDQLLEHYNIDIYKIAKKTGLSWVSNSNQIAYLKPAFLMETVLIESQLIHFNDSELKVEMRMFNEAKTQLKAVIWCGFVHFDLLKQSRAKHSDELSKLFKTIINPVNAISFEERLLEFKAMKIKI